MEFRQRNEFLLQEDDDYGEEGGDRDEQEQLRLDITMADLTDGELRQVEILDKAAEHLLYAKSEIRRLKIIDDLSRSDFSAPALALSVIGSQLNRFKKAPRRLGGAVMELCWKWRKVVNSFQEVRSQQTGSEILNLSGTLEDTVCEILLQPGQNCVTVDAGKHDGVWGRRGERGGNDGRHGGRERHGKQGGDDGRHGGREWHGERHGGGQQHGERGERGGTTEQSASQRSSSPEPSRLKEKFVNGIFQGTVRIFRCPHGIERKSKSKGIRCKQSVNYTGCKFCIRITEKEDKSWRITSMNSEHYGHETTQQNFFIHQNNRKLTPEDRQFVIDMMQGNASNPNMAAALSQRTGRIYSYQDVANLVKRISDEQLVDPLEEHLSAIRSAGGTVQYRKKEGTNDVTCLYVQTASMRAQLFEEKPNTFQVDTTFGTNRENFKLWIPVFKSETTGQWEIGCLLFIETETKINIEHGVRMFRDSLPYNLTRSFFFADKDFDYIHVSVYIAMSDVFTMFFVLGTRRNL